MRLGTVSSRPIAAVVGVVLALGLLPAHAATIDLPLETRRVSLSSTGVEADARSEYPAMSGDGRYVVFGSDASNLVPGEASGQHHVYVHDRLRGETTRASENTAGEPARFGADGGSISRDGRYVVFYSPGSNLVEADTNGRSDVFRKDLVTGAVEMVSIAADGTGLDASALIVPNVHTISDDGRYVVYMSRATNIVPGITPPSSGNHIYVRDMETGSTELVSVGNDGRPGTENAQTPSLSGDGHIAFFETRSALDPNDTNGLMSVYARDHVNDTTELVSANNRGQTANNTAWRPRANYDGTLVVFDSTATNLVPRDQGGISPDVFLRDLKADRTEKVSVSSSGAPPNLEAYRGSISSDGRFVAYWSGATNHVPEKTVWNGDVFVRDRLLGYTELVSRRWDGSLSSNTSHVSQLSGDGKAISFMSFSEDLVPDDTNGVQDVFARQVGPPIGFMAPLEASTSDGELRLEGIARATGALLAEGDDPAGDLIAHGNTSDRVGDISSMDIAYRIQAPQELLFRVSFHDLPFPVFGVAQPGTTYGVSFRVDGRRYEIRMNAAEDIALYPRFELFVCDPVCVPRGETYGGFGTVGHEIHFTASLDDVGGGVGAQLSDVRAFAGIGGSPTGALPVLDETSLGPVDIPALEAAIGLVPAGSTLEEAELTSVPPPVGTRFEAAKALDGFAPGSYEAVARLCMADACGYGSVPVAIGGAPLLIETDMTLALQQVRGDFIATATLGSSDGSLLPGEEIVFSLNGTEWARSVTDDSGAAHTSFHRNEIKKGDVVEALFAGDDTFSSSRSSIEMGDPPRNVK